LVGGTQGKFPLRNIGLRDFNLLYHSGFVFDNPFGIGIFGGEGIFGLGKPKVLGKLQSHFLNFLPF